MSKIAERQHGVFTRAQAREAGIRAGQQRVRIKEGFWVRLRRGVFRLAGCPESELMRLMAATLVTGGVLCGVTAARQFRFDGLPKWTARESIHVLLPHRRRTRNHRRITVHRTRFLEPADVTTHKGIPITTRGRTLADLAAQLDKFRLWGRGRFGDREAAG